MNLETLKETNREFLELLPAKLAALPESVANLWRLVLAGKIKDAVGIVCTGGHTEVAEGEPELMFDNGSTVPFSKVNQPVQSL